MKIITIISFCVLCFTNVFGQTTREENWSKDITFLLAEAKKRHYVYKDKDLPPKMVRQAEELKSRISEYTDERMLIELGRLMYHLGDGHSYILPFAATVTESYFLPLQFYDFSDGVYVIDADDAHARLVGMKVKKINGTGADSMMKGMVGSISQDNTMGARWIGQFALRFRGYLETTGLPKGAKTARIEFVDQRGNDFSEDVAFVPVPQLNGVPKMVPPKNTPPEKVPMYLSNVGENFWLKHLPEKNVLYFQFNQVRNSPNETLRAFSERLEARLAELKPKLLIVDVRHNNGGNGNLTPPLVSVLKKYEGSQKGRIVVLMGRNTFSAAQIFIGRVDAATDAIFAGEPSSSKPNFVGEESEVVLPFSGARGSISDRYHESIPGDKRMWIQPDLHVPPSSKDFLANRDRLLEEVLKKYAN